MTQEIDAGGGGPFLYRFYRESFNAALERAGLLFDLEFSLTTTVADIIRHLQTVMETGPHSFVFNTRSPLRSLNSNLDEAVILPHEALPFSLLGLVNRGRPRTDGHVHLTARPSQSLTLQSLVTNPNNYANEHLCIEESRLVIHFCKI